MSTLQRSSVNGRVVDEIQIMQLTNMDELIGVAAFDEASGEMFFTNKWAFRDEPDRHYKLVPTDDANDYWRFVEVKDVENS